MLLKVYKSRVWILLFMLMPFISYAQPPGWNPTMNPTSAVYAIPTTVTFDGVDALAPGDYIGVFYDDAGTLECGGMVEWTGTENVAIVAFGNDTLVAPDKNGFSDGEAVQWKFWYATSGEEVEVFSTPEFNWVNGDLGEVETFWVETGCTQNINYVHGWNWISFYALPDVPTITNVMADYLASAGDVLKTQTGSAFYNGAMWLPPTFNINPDYSYQLYVNGDFGDFTVEGNCIDVTDPIDITGGGWSWIGYKPETAMTPAVALASLAPFLPQDIVKTQVATAFYTGTMWLPPSFTMQRGEGYKLKYQGSDNTLVYPDADGVSEGDLFSVAPKLPKDAPDWTPEPGMENNMSIYVNSATLEGVTVPVGSLVGAFKTDGDICRGVAPFEDYGMGPQAVLTVGFNSDEEGNPYYYLVWDSDADIIYEVNETGNFENNAFLTVDLTLIPQAVTTTISGTVTDEATGLPLDGVEITATPVALDDAPDWTPEPGMENNMSIYVNSATLDGNSVAVGSLVGAFKTESGVCRGVAPFEDYGMGPQAVLTVGFNSDEEGDAYYYQVWDAATDMIYDVNETGNFENNAFLTVDLTLIPGIEPMVTFTDADGNYQFDDVPDANWMICTGVTTPTDGYIDECAELPVTTPPSQVVDFELTPECMDASISNWPAGADDACSGTNYMIDFTEVVVENATNQWWAVNPADAGEVIDDIFFLDMNFAEGDVTISLTAVAEAPCADAYEELTFHVNPLPDVTLEVYEPMCEGSDVFDLYGGLPEGGTYYVDGEVATTFDPAVAGTYALVYEYTDENGCTNTAEGEILVNPLPEVTLEAYEPMCEGSEVFDLYGGLPEGGTYYVDGEVATTFDPAVAGTYALVYEYTDENGCTNTAEGEILVNPLPEVMCPEDFGVCIDDEAIELTGGAQPVGGEYAGDGVNGGYFFPGDAGLGEHVITYTYTDENGCTNFCEFTITVNPLPEVECPDNYWVCEGSEYIEFPAVPDGVYTNEAGEVVEGFDPVEAGFYTFTLTVTNEFDCSASCEFTVEVEPLPVPYAGADATISSTVTYQILDNTVDNMDPEDWVWWETAGDGTFDDNLAMHPVYTPGEDDITNGSVVLTFWVHSFYCDVDVSDEMVLTIVTGCVDAEINNWPEDPEDLCVGEELTIDFTGVEILNATSTEWIIDPEEAGTFDGDYFVLNTDYVGDVVISLTAFATPPCNDAFAELMFTVNPLPEVTLEVYEPMCEGSEAFDLYGGLPEGGTYFVDGEEATTFDPVAAGTYTLEYVYTDENGCTNSAFGEILVNPLPEVVCPESFEVCLNDEPWELYGATPEGGDYSGDGVADNVFSPEVAGVGVHEITYTYTDENGCTNSCTFEITVNPLPYVDIELSAEEICLNETLTATLTGPEDGAYPYVLTGTLNGEPYTGVMEGPEKVLELTAPEAGTYEGVLLSIEDANGCIAEPNDVFVVVVNPLPYVDIELSAEEICLNETLTATLTGPEDGAYPYVLTGTLNGEPYTGVMEGPEKVLELTAPEAGTYEGVLLSIEDANGCIAEPNDVFVVVVNPLPYVDIELSAEEICLNETLTATLTGPEDGAYPYTLTGTLNGEPYTGVMEGPEKVLELTAPAAGTYEGILLSIEDANGCIAEPNDVFVVVVNPLPYVDVELSATEICYNQTITIMATGPEDGAYPYDITYMINGETFTEVMPSSYEELVLTPPAPGEYEGVLVSIVDANGCTAEPGDVFNVTVLPGVNIITQPASVDVLYGGTAVFAVEAENATGYQWFGPAGEIFGANEATFTIEGVTPGDEGDYYCVVAGDCDEVESDHATLTVLPWTQVIPLEGAVNGASTYLDLIEDDVATIFADLDLNAVEFYAPTQVYVPGGVSFAWDEAKGAKVSLNDGFPTDVTVQGWPTLGYELALPAGWSLMPVWSYDVVSADDVLGQLGDDLIAAFSMDYSGIYWPAYNIYTLENLVPGSAYLVALANAGTVSFDVAKSDASAPAYVPYPRNLTSWNDVTMSGIQHNIAITASALSSLQVGDVIGAFNQDGAIAGMVEVTSLNQNIALRLYGSETVAEGDVLNFKVYRNGDVFDAEAIFDPNMPNTNVFAKEGLSAITGFKAGVTSVNDITANLNVSLYPNPATDFVNIETNFEIKNLKVVNYVGQVVFNQEINQVNYQINTSNFGTGMYFVQIENAEGVVITKRLTVK